MYWLDLAIIYFALGAPFGVLRITAKREVTVFAYLRMASGYLLWPLVAIRNVARFLAEARASVRASTLNASTSHNASERQVHQDIDAIRIELEQALFANGGEFSMPADTRPESEEMRYALYAFREVFYRYTGLAAANAEFRMQNAEWSDSNSTFNIRHSTLVRSACIARRDRLKLEAQLAQARSELNDMFKSDKLLPALDQLATDLGDKTLFDK